MGGQKWADAEIGKRLRRLREDTQRSWTQQQMADMLSEDGAPMTAAQIARIEKGQRSVRAVEAAVFADRFGVSVDALLGRRARPKADLMRALRGALDAKEQARWAVSSHQQTLSEATSELGDADSEGRYAPLVADCERACKALDAAAQILASVGDSTNPQTAAAIREGITTLMRAWLDEQETK
jgi:transcriptional regulator with XRE-family HTH domain